MTWKELEHNVLGSQPWPAVQVSFSSQTLVCTHGYPSLLTLVRSHKQPPPGHCLGLEASAPACGQPLGKHAWERDPCRPWNQLEVIKDRGIQDLEYLEQRLE